MRRVPRARKAVAGVLVAALLWVTPGVGTYSVLANTGIASIQVQIPVGGTMLGGVGAGLMIPDGLMGRPLAAPGLNGSFNVNPALAPVGQTPTVSPSLPPSLGLPASAVQAGEGARLTRAQPVPVGGPGSFEFYPVPLPMAKANASPDLASPDPVVSMRQPAGALAAAAASFRAPQNTQDVSESLHPLRGQPNRLGERFRTLLESFGMRKDADLDPRASRMGSIQGDVSTEPPALESPVQEAVAQEGPALPLKPPAALTLRSSQDETLSVVIEELPAVVAKGVEAGVQIAGRASPAQAQAPAEKSPWLGLGKVAAMFIAALVVAQIGVEALAVALPTLVQKAFGDFTAVAQLAIFSSVAAVVGRQAGPLVIDKLGLKKSYLWASALRMVSISLLAGLLATGNMTLPLMTLFYSFNGLLSGVSLTALESIPPALVGQDAGRIERFWTWEQTILEIIGITGPIITGALVASYGFLPAMVAFPVTMAASLAIVLATLKIPKELDTPRRPAEGPKAGFFSRVSQGARVVWRNPLLRYSFLAYTVYLMMNPYLYTMIAPAYGLRLVGEANAELATSVIGWLTGLYSAGGLLGGFLMMAEQRRTDARKAAMRKAEEEKAGPISDEGWAERIAPWEREVLRKSMLRWMLYGALGLVSFATLMFPIPTLGSLVALPGWLGTLTLPALALVPYGAAYVGAVLKLRSFFQSRVPDEKDMPDAMGFMGAASLTVSTLGLLALKYVFKAAAGLTPFYWIALSMIPMFVFYLYLKNRLDRHSRPS
jgi:MFS family permease